MSFYTDEQLAYIRECRAEGMTWEATRKEFEALYDEAVTSEALRKALYRADLCAELDVDEADTALLRRARGHQNRARRTAAENRKVLDAWLQEGDILERIERTVRSIKLPKARRLKAPTGTRKRGMTKELLLSDIHFGKATDTFNHDVCLRRLDQVVDAVRKSVARDAKVYRIDRLVVALMGDVIENYEMHGVESARGCEAGTAEQIQWAIEGLFLHVLVPLAQLGIPVYVPCVTGNHDRPEPAKTYHLPGKVHYTWVVYNTLKLLCQRTGLKNVEFEIVEGPYLVYQVYGANVLVEHGDLLRSIDRKSVESQIAKRQAQENQVLHMARFGHYHEPTEFGRGRGIINGGVPGPDSYSTALGFDTEPVQMLIDYVETRSRPTPYFRSFPILLR